MRGTPEPPSLCRLRRVFPGVVLREPVEVCIAPGGGDLLVAERGGRVLQVRAADGGTEAGEARPVFDARQEIEGFSEIYGMAFDPGFPGRPVLWLCYVMKPGLEDGTRVSRFEVDPGEDGWRVDAASERVVLTWISGGHNGGCLRFGPDGFLYIATGDAAGPTPPDPLMTGQDCSDLLASILRIDVHAEPAVPGAYYAIPEDNPFRDLEDVRPEIWAYGFRNPWKMAFDRATGALWVADVGWDLWEMVFRVERGGNYGWSVTEGAWQPIHPDADRGPNKVITPPVAQHAHSEARSITGGHVYRGGRMEELAGSYVYGDYETGKIWAVREGESPRELADTSLRVIAFAEMSDGEILVVGYSGELYVLESNPPSGATGTSAAFPATLSETGLFEDVASHRPAAGVFAYEIAAPMWHDGARAERLVAVPGDGVIGGGRGGWDFPEGAVLVKTLSLPSRPGDITPMLRLETQLLHRHAGEWRGYTYAWNAAQTDAELVDGSGGARVVTVGDPAVPGGERQQLWRYASRADCLACHTYASGYTLAADVRQWNTPGQLERLADAGLFRARPSAGESFPHPADPNLPVETRARAYLHMNCAHCHRDNGGGVVPLRLEQRFALGEMRALGAPLRGDFGIAGARVVAPGDPSQSILLYRMAKAGSGRMPHLGSQVVDDHGVRLIAEWIRQCGNAADAIGTGELGDPEQALAAPASALAAADALRRFAFPPGFRERLLDAAAGHPLAEVRDLIRPFMAEEVSLPAAVDPVAVLSLPGDVDRGAALLHGKAAVCLTCHQVAGRGTAVGPALDAIGARRSRSELLASLLEPSAAIDPQFRAFMLTRADDGSVAAGIIVERDADQLRFRDVAGSESVVPGTAIALLEPMPLSLMPAGLAAAFTPLELADLVAWLASLSQDGSE